MQTTPVIQSTSLHFREGSSDKVYHAAIEAHAGGYIVTIGRPNSGGTQLKYKSQAEAA